MASRTPQELNFFLTRTFFYEASMMRETHKLLGERKVDEFPGDVAMKTVLTNALIESFCIHVRNIIDFFRNREKQDFKPMWFTNSAYRPTTKDFLDLSLVEKLNAQIAHMSAKRTSVDSEKIGGRERDAIIAAVEHEIDRFHKALVAEFLSKWKLGGRYYGMTPDSMMAATTSAPSTTNHIDIAVLKIGDDDDNAKQ